MITINPFIYFDKCASHFLADLVPHTPFFDSLFAFLSLEGNWLIIWAIIGILVFFTEIRQDKRFIIYMFLASLITYLTVQIVFKNIAQRHRPWIAQQLEAPLCPEDYSFPSTHAAGAFAGATILAAFDRPRRKVYYLGAFLIAFSRIYLLCHYFFDVTAGAIIGYLISKMMLMIKIGTKPITK